MSDIGSLQHSADVHKKEKKARSDSFADTSSVWDVIRGAVRGIYMFNSLNGNRGKSIR